MEPQRVWGIEQRMQFGTKPYLGLQTGYIILEKTDKEYIQLSLLASEKICKLGYRIHIIQFYDGFASFRLFVTLNLYPQRH